VGKLNPHTQQLWKTVWRLLKKLNIDLPYDPATTLLLKECQSGYNKAPVYPMFIAALFTIVKLWKQPRCPTTDERIKKIQGNFIQPQSRINFVIGR
jgi:hypothetical protein